MKESDAVVFLLSVDSPINQIEIEFLRNTKEYAGKFYFAVNKTDTVNSADLDAYVTYCSKLLSTIMETEDIKLFPVSARTGAGVEDLKKTILKDCKKNAREILEESTEKKLKDAVNSALTQLDFYWNAMNMDYKSLDEKFAAVAATIEEIKADAETKEMLFEMYLNEYRIKLSAKVLELFGMEYHYHIEQLPAGLVQMSKADFIDETAKLCEDLNSTLNTVLLYREENAYAVCRRINNINRLTRKLRTIRDKL